MQHDVGGDGDVQRVDVGGHRQRHPFAAERDQIGRQASHSRENRGHRLPDVDDHVEGEPDAYC
jgi:hypothetical protein